MFVLIAISILLTILDTYMAIKTIQAMRYIKEETKKLKQKLTG